MPNPADILMTAPAPLAHTLRVKNLPGVLSAEAVAALLTHHGAAHVKLLRAGSRRTPQAAIAAFANRAARDTARTRLNALQLAGHRVHAEPVKDAGDADAQPPLPPGPPPPPPTSAPPPPAVVNSAHSQFTPAPLAPHLGFVAAACACLLTVATNWD